MKKAGRIIISIILGVSMFLAVSAPVDAYTSVRGYYRSNGTYVKPYVRSNPNGLKYDNYGYSPRQGSYNSTYGRSTYWNTPTYITDRNYYEGLNIYKSNSYSGSYYSTYRSRYSF